MVGDFVPQINTVDRFQALLGRRIRRYGTMVEEMELPREEYRALVRDAAKHPNYFEPMIGQTKICGVRIGPL